MSIEKLQKCRKSVKFFDYLLDSDYLSAYPMVMIGWSSITIPTPQPFDKTQPEQQRENLSYVLLQILTEAKAQNDNDPFGLLGALEASASAVQVELDDLNIKVFGNAAIIESI